MRPFLVRSVILNKLKIQKHIIWAFDYLFAKNLSLTIIFYGRINLKVMYIECIVISFTLLFLPAFLMDGIAQPSQRPIKANSLTQYQTHIAAIFITLFRKSFRKRLNSFFREKLRHTHNWYRERKNEISISSSPFQKSFSETWFLVST